MIHTWTEKNNKLQKDFEFKDFKSAWSFMNAVAEVAEEMNHHPDWSNSYNKVSISIFSHEAGKATERDHRLATKIDAIADGYI